MENSVLSYNSTIIFPLLTLAVPSAGFTNLFSYTNIIANDSSIKNGRKIKGTLRCYITKSNASNPTMEYRLNIGGNYVTLPQFSMPGLGFTIPSQVIVFDFTIQKLDVNLATVYFEMKRINGTGILNHLFVLPTASVPVDFSLTNILAIEGRIVAGAGVTVETRVKQSELTIQ